MKMSFAVGLALCSAFAAAQVPDSSPTVEGRYESLQRQGSLRRTLRLDRDGTAEVVTRARDAGHDRAAWTIDDSTRYGQTALAAMRGKSVHHTGRWELRGNEVVVRLTNLRLEEGRWDRIELRLRRRRDEMVLDHKSDTYGESPIIFHREETWRDDRPSESRFGYLRYDRETLPVDEVELADGRFGEPHLKIWAGDHVIDIQGDESRRGDEMIFRLRQGMGEYRLTLRDGWVERIEGKGSYDHHRIEFVSRPDR